MADFINRIAGADEGRADLLLRFGDDAGADETPAGGEMLFQRLGQHADHRGQNVGHGKIKRTAQALEQITLDKMTAHEKQRLSVTFAELVYNGQWFTPLREALSAFVTKTQERVTGKVRLKLYKGNIIRAGMWSPYSLYSEEIATFGASDYDQTDAAGFINLYGLPIRVQAMVNQANKE